MANYSGNPVLGGVKLVGPETVEAFSAFQRISGQSGGMGLGELLRMGSSGVPRVDVGNPIIQGLVQSGSGGVGGRDLVSVLMDLLGSGLGSGDGIGSGVDGGGGVRGDVGVGDVSSGSGVDVLGELASAVVEILSRSPHRFIGILRSNPDVLNGLVRGITKGVDRG